MTITRCILESDDGRRIVVELQQPGEVLDTEGHTVERAPPSSRPGLAKCAGCNVVPMRRAS